MPTATTHHGCAALLPGTLLQGQEHARRLRLLKVPHLTGDVADGTCTASPDEMGSENSDSSSLHVLVLVLPVQNSEIREMYTLPTTRFTEYVTEHVLEHGT